MNPKTYLTGIFPKQKSVLFPFFFYIFGILLLFFYTFTQVDLSLTITRTSLWQPIQYFFQYIGYFNRPLSTALYLLIVVILFVGYLLLFVRVKKAHLSSKTIWALILFAGGLLLFSYNAFSYDLFNYIFDAKIITHYHANPYLHKALDYPGDPMLSFMRWTHRTYPYGPSWLFLTVPLSFLGLGYFIPTFFIFKAGIITCYIGTCFFIKKIAEKLHPGSGVHALVLFALNPLIIIECVVSAHNDIVMLFFALLGLWLILNHRVFTGFLGLVFSIGVKFATGLFLPVFVYLSFKNRTVERIEKSLFVLTILSVVMVLIATFRTNFQPWYVVTALGFVSLLSAKRFIIVPSLLFSCLALLQYVPYLFLGNYDPPVPTILFYGWLAPFFLSSGVGLVLFFKRESAHDESS